MEPIITFVTENVSLTIVAVILFVPLAVIYQTKVAPVIFHTIEYFLYLTLAHYMIYAMVQVVAWYKSQTPDINDAGATPFNTPRGIISQNFLDKSLYNPTGLLYFELGVAFFLLYIVVVVRPTTYSTANKHKGNKDRGMPGERGGGRYDRSKASSQKSQKS